jgi:hypothetical protein
MTRQGHCGHLRRCAENIQPGRQGLSGEEVGNADLKEDEATPPVKTPLWSCGSQGLWDNCGYVVKRKYLVLCATYWTIFLKMKSR